MNELEDLKKVKETVRPVRNVLVLAAGSFLLLLSLLLAVSLGAADMPLKTVWQAIFQFDPDLQQHQIIREIRFPRILGAAIVGSCFAVSGALMQGMTRNPLADSGLLGLNAGAVFMLACCFAFFPHLSYVYIILFSFLGAALGAGIVYGIGSLSKNGLTPIRLVLAGAAVSALLGALSEGIALYYEIGQDLAFWYAGGISGTSWGHLQIITPWLLLAVIAAVIISRSITLLSLGEEVAVGLGTKTGRIKLTAALIIVVLAGLAVSVVGAVSFVGLIVPHMVRWLFGYDYRWIIPGTVIYGALLVVLADLAARIISPPHEMPVGALIALLGVPFFLYLARKGGGLV
ncbi:MULTISPECIES: FecCD family ABC transporter permease [Oceanobacillus]|uniref:Iron-uptake system permease protein FeuB n=2 Tax=Oceanobacillus TaxID=182709 RepID=A0A0A1MIH8_9BACI|nr:iron ABC transporter permease [Oceanobacillus oncorhynchi]MDM8100707.1 iron ABC transporter permease [Oceanobacillus oncorhynchi]UUI41435.1 iron ABC transporter permease [Oceanobacillus oncorhynchi]CEI82868.1 Iron-uptake system permease protein FeuB [Oceanobacillus oncorhynchi]